MDTLTADMLAETLQEPKKALLAKVLRTLGACPRINVYGPLIPRQPYGEGVWMGTPAVSILTVVRHNWFTDGMTPCQEVLAVPMAPRVGVTQ